MLDYLCPEKRFPGDGGRFIYETMSLAEIRALAREQIAVNTSGVISKRVPSVQHPPKGSRTRQPIERQSFTRIKKESIVTKRVPFGELFVFLRTKQTNQLTPDAERSAVGRFAFPAFVLKGFWRFRSEARCSLFRES